MLDTITKSETTTTPATAPFRVDPNRGGHNGEVSMQWMARPADQRFTSLDDLHAFKKKFWDNSFQTRVRSNEFELIAPEPKTQADLHKLTVGVKVASGGDVVQVREVAPTHWAFGQLAGLAKSPASFLRELPTPIVSDVLGWRLRHAREVEEVKLYGGAEELYAATGPDYGRIPDFEVVEAVRAVAGSGRGEKRWKIPGVLDWTTNLYDPEAPVQGLDDAVRLGPRRLHVPRGRSQSDRGRQAAERRARSDVPRVSSCRTARSEAGACGSRASISAAFA